MPPYEPGRLPEGTVWKPDRSAWANALFDAECGSVYTFRNGTGEGTITSYPVFPGVLLAYSDFHMRYYVSEFRPDGPMFCIDHCREGRLEYPARDSAFSYVEAGDLKLDRRLTHAGQFEMPLSHYHGITISFQLDTASRSLPLAVRDLPIDLSRLQARFCRDAYPFVLRSSPAIAHIFSELYAVPEKIRLPYFKIKVLELLLYLEALELPEKPAEKPYFYRAQVEAVKEIQQFLTQHLDEHFTQSELSARFGISLTSMKQCFRSVFGSSIGVWLTQYRMNQAAFLLRSEPRRSVAEIAGQVGYDNPSKFALAFRRVMDASPTEYRRRFHLPPDRGHPGG